MTPRLTSLPLPPYTYVPGQQPHPRSDTAGHSHGEPEPVVTRFNSKEWRDCETYLFGLDLFNHGYYWESHEQWEAVWIAQGRTGTVADFLKGLIKLAAAGVKAKEAKPQGVERHLSRARQLFSSVQVECERLCGLDLAELIDSARTESTEAAIQRAGLSICLVPNDE